MGKNSKDDKNFEVRFYGGAVFLFSHLLPQITNTIIVLIVVICAFTASIIDDGSRVGFKINLYKV